MFETCENCGGLRIPRRCPHCGTVNDGHTAVDGSSACPQAGDVSICLYCSGVAIFTEHSLRVLDDAEFNEVMADPEMQQAIQVIAQMRAEGEIPPCR